MGCLINEQLTMKNMKLKTANNSIRCDECGKFLFNTSKHMDNKGAIGAEAQDKGFTYKNACLFSNEYSSLYFCNDECAKSFYKKNIPSDKEVTSMLNKMKGEIPEMARDIAGKMEKLVKEGRITKIVFLLAISCLLFAACLNTFECYSISLVFNMTFSVFYPDGRK